MEEWSTRRSHSSGTSIAQKVPNERTTRRYENWRKIVFWKNSKKVMLNFKKLTIYTLIKAL
jgi:hypothetical protein